MTTHIREPMHLSMSSVHPFMSVIDKKEDQAGFYLEARFVVKPLLWGTKLASLGPRSNVV